jgi:transketolase
MNSEPFWETKRPFAERYGVSFQGADEPAPTDEADIAAQFRANLQVVMDVLQKDEGLVDYLADRLVELGDAVPQQIPSLKLDTSRNPFQDERLYDFRNYPAELYLEPGAKEANRVGLRKFGAWVNSFGAENYGRPIFIACSADLAGSTNISGFAEGFGDFDGWGWYDRETNPDGALLPQEITEFTNAGIMAGLASVNFSENPYEEFNGFWGACSTYGAFVYLKYGLMRLYSQLAQDSQIKTGKILWVAGHSGPETAEDSRTHFGVFSPGVTQLFPRGQIIDIHPWEFNEVPVLTAAALRTSVPIVALHLTRPPIEIPDREALGIPSHFDAARGAYVMRNFRADQPVMGTVIVQGTSSTANLVKVLPDLDREGLNVKVVAAASPELFAMQPADYREQVLSDADWMDSMCITNRSLGLMRHWLRNQVAEEYSMGSDWDGRWRTGGRVEELIEEAHLSPEWILKGIERFVRDRDQRLGRLRSAVAAALDR